MPEKVSTEVKCTDCGKTTNVPFKPTAGKPVYCRECLAKHRTKRTPPKTSSANEKQVWSRRREVWKGRTEQKVTA